MKKQIWFISIVFSILAICTMAHAQAVAVPTSADQAISMLGVFYGFIHNGQWLLAGGVLTLVICFALNRYLFPRLKLGAAITPIASAIIGALGGVGLAVANGASLQQAMLAMLSGSVATHFWEAIGQYFVAKKPIVSATLPQAPIQTPKA